MYVCVYIQYVHTGETGQKVRFHGVKFRNQQTYTGCNYIAFHRHMLARRLVWKCIEQTQSHLSKGHVFMLRRCNRGEIPSH
jgi:hypothetical protein